MATPNYFTCTLGQAAHLELTNPEFRNISGLIDSRLEQTPDLPAVGFASSPSNTPGSQSWVPQVSTFLDLANTSTALAVQLRDTFKDIRKSQTVALLCPSTSIFLFTWLALMRLGHPVLLIAPQCQPAAIAHLCQTCDIIALIYEDQYEELAKRSGEVAAEKGQTLQPLLLPFYDGASIQAIGEKAGQLQFPDPEPTDVAYLHHTSGTSSGLPKPIPQTHRAGAGVLPSFPDGHRAATFTTTPLYHGGIADAFRAWTSGAMIWLFPGKGIPITASNIVRCLDIAAEQAQAGKAPPVKYFSSVPYVLQSMEADERGLQYLQSMDIVGVGGAALPAEVGDRLIKSGVNLISRFGSAECGFLMSSHRDYAKDKEWQYLRSDVGSKLLQFEKQDTGLVELVIRDGWPHMAKRNRDDGSFATADLFAPHSSIANAWRYHSRADSQLTLITGKKFDPASLENAIATTDLLEDVLIFGNGQPYPGALLFRSDKASQLSDVDLISQLWPTIEKLNRDTQDHARIMKKMLIAMTKLDTPLEKSSKGTIIRGAAEKRFADDIEQAYSSTVDKTLSDVPDDEIVTMVTSQIQSITNKPAPPAPDADLYAYGVDSVAGMQIRNSIRQLIPNLKKALPLNIVEDCGTVERLADWILKTRHGETIADTDAEERQLMLDLVEKYGRILKASAKTNGQPHAIGLEHQTPDDDAPQKDVVVLTGVTGALGAHILDLYSRSDTTKRIYCLVRGASDHACKERVSKALAARNLGALSDKVVILGAQLGEEKLGLGDNDYSRLAHEATIILHVAWAVNFRMRLRAFERDHVGGLTNLLGLTLSSRRARAPRFGFCSSVASALSYTPTPIPEAILASPASASPLGYSRSKWVGEQLCSLAAGLSAGISDDSTIRVFRVGQLGGDDRRGVWNVTEAWPLMLAVGIKELGAMPDLRTEKLDWLPVDIAARALVEGMMREEGSGSMGALDGGETASTRMMMKREGRDDGAREQGSGQATRCCSVAHVVHDGANPSWGQMLVWLQKERQRRGQKGFEVVDPGSWVEMLEGASGEGTARQGGGGDYGQDASRSGEGEGEGEGDGIHRTHPAFKLLELWKSAYGTETRVDTGRGKHAAAVAAPVATREDDEQEYEEKRKREDGGGQSASEGREGPLFEMGKTKAAIPTLRHLRPVDEAYVVRIWTWIDENM
ncbi:L-2-aminoadipate reductase [Sphaceloma murrayae]|uniref:L-2-aminoadipate reductase n=1 Tax=Sphaceloma murrayae TaxID=2082308 RepID=A0A2K1QRP5_9PEZI|nr:L-2-aminoadipate reductase [Sphaceloma murrayae]